MSGLLDPWRDAQVLHEHARRPDSRLIVVLGAEAWCEKCRQFRSVFDESVASHPKDAWVWLDIEDHAEFIPDFTPDDLPLLMVFTRQNLRTASFMADCRKQTLEDAMNANDIYVDRAIALQIFEQLTAQNWAR